jgi:uncharacterized membrane protein YfcA
LSAGEALLVVLGGLFAGTANTIAGGGSLLTFPLLVALGLPPLDANVTNTVGIVPAAIGGSFGYRGELRGQGRRLLALLPLSVAGAAGGAALLLLTPAHVFTRVVPVLILVACVALFFQRGIARWLDRSPRSRTLPLVAGVLATAVYGGYFGAAVSVIILAILAITVDDRLSSLNALKVPLAGTMNLVSGIAFILFAPVHWAFIAALAPSTLVGGRLGAALARRVPEQGLRIAVVVLGIAGAVWLEVSQ